MNIEFVIPCLDPLGNPTNGITRTVCTNVYSISNSDTVKSLIQWSNSNYYNIWIVKPSIANSSTPGLPDSLDGSINGYQGFLEYLTHETGHWVGLPHTFGSLSSNINCNLDDGILDTPISIGGNFICDTNRTTCLSDPEPFLSIQGDTLLTTGQIIDPIQNHMEYGCFFSAQNFTEGQKVFCHTTLNSSISHRNEIWTDSNLVKTGIDSSICGQTIPISNFYVAKDTICDLDTLYFKGNAYNSDSIHYSWLFPGGNPTTSNSVNPIVIYSIPGNYTASLIASNSYGADTSSIDITVDNCNGLSIIENELTFTITPNPSSGKFVIHNSSIDNTFYSITTIDGKVIQKGKLIGELTSIIIKEKGMYLIQLNRNGVISKPQKVVVN